MKTTKNYFLLLILTLGIGLFNTSCSSSDDSGGNDDDNPPPAKKELIISASNTSIKINDIVNFTAKFEGKVIEDIQFTVNGIGIESNNYTFSELGEFKVQAKKVTGEMSNTLTISVFKDEDEINNATKFVHSVLVEDFTGAWCQYCPRVAYKLEQLETTHPENIVAIAIHNSQNSNASNGGYDPFDFFKSERNAYERELGVSGYPFAMINRVDDFEDNYDQFTSYIQPFSPIGIKINSDIYATDGTVKIGVKFGENYTGGLKYAVFMLEDHLLFRQSNSTSYYANLPRNGNFSLDFEHNNTLVGMANGFKGTEIASSATVKGGEFNTEIYMRHRASKLENTKIVIVVTDMSGKVLNVASTKSNTNMNYQIVR